MNDTMKVIAYLLEQNQVKDTQITALTAQITAMQSEVSKKVVAIDSQRNTNAPAVPEAN